MYFLQELLLTCALSIIVAFLLSKLASSPSRPNLHPLASTSDLISGVDLPTQSTLSEEIAPIEIEASSSEKDAQEESEEKSILMQGNESSGRGEATSDEVQMELREGRLELEIEEQSSVGFEDKAAKEESVEKEEDEEEEEEGSDNARSENAISVRSDGEVIAKDNDVEKEKGSLIYDEEEWEGIERSELEKRFSAMARSVELESADMLAKIGSDVQMQLYGLHKVATEGPCFEPQPSVLKVTARAKWHAWQRLGNMNPEMAMEQYITLLSDNIPGLVGENPRGTEKEEEAGIQGTEKEEQAGTSSEGASWAVPSDLSSFSHHQMSSENGRAAAEGHYEAKNVVSGSEFVEQGRSAADSA